MNCEAQSKCWLGGSSIQVLLSKLGVFAASACDLGSTFASAVALLAVFPQNLSPPQTLGLLRDHACLPQGPAVRVECTAFCGP